MPACPRDVRLQVSRNIFLFLSAIIILAFTGCEVKNPVSGDVEIREAFLNQRSGFFVESTGRVERILKDDVEGARHQRFILRLDSGRTLLMTHNIDIAPRIENLQVGEAVHFRGMYEFNDKGGVVHWTHRNPDGRKPGGWIEYKGKKYQ